MGGWTGTADGASSGGLAGEPTASARGAQWISGRDSPHRRQWLLSAFILYLPSTFTFSDHCSKKTRMRKVLQKERVRLTQGLSPRTLSPGSCHTQALEGKEPRWQEGATANPALLRDHSPKGRCRRRTFSADSWIPDASSLPPAEPQTAHSSAVSAECWPAHPAATGSPGTDAAPAHAASASPTPRRSGGLTAPSWPGPTETGMALQRSA